jgi:hypothetical protein
MFEFSKLFIFNVIDCPFGVKIKLRLDAWDCI